MVVLLLGLLVGVADDHAVAEGPGFLLDRAGQGGEVRVEHVADDETECAGLIGAQRAGEGVGPVAEGFDGCEDASARVRADGGMAVEDTGDRGDRDSCLGRDILDARHFRDHLLVVSVRLETSSQGRGIDYTDDWNRLHGRKQPPPRSPRPDRDAGRAAVGWVTGRPDSPARGCGTGPTVSGGDGRPAPACGAWRAQPTATRATPGATTRAGRNEQRVSWGLPPCVGGGPLLPERITACHWQSPGMGTRLGASHAGP